MNAAYSPPFSPPAAQAHAPVVQATPPGRKRKATAEYEDDEMPSAPPSEGLAHDEQMRRSAMDVAVVGTDPRWSRPQPQVQAQQEQQQS